MSTPLRLLVRSGLRHHWADSLFVAILSALTITVCATALTVSRLTLTAFPRTLDAAGAPDVTVHLGDPAAPGPDEPVAPQELSAIPGIARMSLVQNTLGSEVDAEGRFTEFERTALLIAIDGVPAYPLLRGRMPSSESADEVAISSYASEIFGADIGDHIRYAVATRAEIDEIGRTGADHGGTVIEPTVVGVFGPVTIDGPVAAPTDQSVLVVGAAFLDGHPGVGTYYQAGVTLQDDTSVAEFSRTLEQQFGGLVDFETRIDDEALARRAVEPEAYSVLGFALLAGLIGLVVTALSIGRQMTAGGDELTLLALGLNRRQRATQRWMKAACAIAVGVLTGGVATAIATDRIGAIGVASAFDRPGANADDLSLAFGAELIVAALLALIAAASAWRNSRLLRQLPPPNPAPDWLAAIVRATPTDVRTAAALAGRGTGAHRATRAALLGIATSVAIVVSVITFAGSLDALVTTPSLYGSDFDLATWDGYNVIPDDVINTALRSDSDITEIARAASMSGSVNGRAAGLTGFDNFAVGAVVTRGVYPSAVDEVLLGRRLARRLGVGIGDTVDVVVGDASQSYQVVGIGVTPEQTGDGAAFTFEGFQRVVEDAAVGFQYVRVRPSANLDDVMQHFAEACAMNCEIARPSPPQDLAYLNRASDVQRWAVAFVVLLGTALSINALLIVGRRSRRSVAVLRAIGATRKQVTRYLMSQALLIVLIAIVLGIALGAIVGPFMWGRFADALGIVPNATQNVGAVALAVSVLLVITTAVAAIPAWRAASRQVATDLRTD